LADSFTAHLNLTKPEIGASRDSWGTKLNADMDALDGIFASGGNGTSVGLHIGSGKTLTVSGSIVVTGTATGLSTPSGTETLTNKTISGSSNSITNVSIEGSTTGTLPFTRGGTGVTGTPAAGQLLIGTGSGFSLGTLTAGSNITISNSAGGISISSTASGGGGGTVTLVQLSTGTTGLTTSGSTLQGITGAGTFTLGGTLAITNGGTGATSASAARTSLGLGTIATQNSNGVTITGGTVTGITDLAIADGGTGASTAAAALAALGALPLAGGQTSGNILIGQGSTITPGAGGDTTTGGVLAVNGSMHLSNNGAYVQSINRNSDGASVVFHRSGVDVGSVDVTSSATTYNTSSDRSRKENFRTFDGLAMVEATMTYLHDWKGLPDEPSSYGVIADEAIDVLPRAVSGSPGNMQVDYSKYVPILLNACKTLAARVDALELA
jgi:hypothetical protein